jgi:predicted transport protein
MFKMAITKHQNIKSKKKGGGELLNALNDFEISFRKRTEVLRECINNGKNCEHGLMNKMDSELFTIFKNHILDEGLKQKIHNLLVAIRISDNLTTYLKSRPNKAISLNMHVNPHERSMLKLIGEIRSYYEKEYNNTTSQKSVMQNNVRQNNSPNVRQNNSPNVRQNNSFEEKIQGCEERIQKLKKWILDYDKRAKASLENLRTKVTDDPQGKCLAQYIAPNQKGNLRNQNYLLNDGDIKYFSDLLTFINNTDLKNYINGIIEEQLNVHLHQLNTKCITKTDQLYIIPQYVYTVNTSIVNNIEHQLQLICNQFVHRFL